MAETLGWKVRKVIVRREGGVGGDLRAVAQINKDDLFMLAMHPFG